MRKITPYIALILLVIILQAPLSEAGGIRARVVRVIDGDSLVVQPASGGWIRVRLWGIDAPEWSQPFGPQARQHLIKLAAGAWVFITVRDYDIYRRAISEVRLENGPDPTEEMVRAGLAWWNRKYAPLNKKLEQIEEEARQGRRGLWQRAAPTPPWVWRKKNR